jgi:hypothetical protein
VADGTQGSLGADRQAGNAVFASKHHREVQPRGQGVNGQPAKPGDEWGIARVRNVTDILLFLPLRYSQHKPQRYATQTATAFSGKVGMVQPGGHPAEE